MALAGSLVTAAFTALLGTILLVVGQVVQRFLLEPIQEQSKTLGEVAYCLTFLANISHVEPSRGGAFPADPREASKDLRRLAGRLRASLWTVPLYDTLAARGWLLPRS